MDQSSVLNSLTSIARKDRMFTVIPNMVEQVAFINVRAMRNAIDVRLRAAEERQIARHSPCPAAQVCQILAMKDCYKIPNVGQSDVQLMKENENVRIQSQRRLSRKAFTIGLFVMVIISPIWEELFKVWLGNKLALSIADYYEPGKYYDTKMYVSGAHAYEPEFMSASELFTYNKTFQMPPTRGTSITVFASNFQLPRFPQPMYMQAISDPVNYEPYHPYSSQMFWKPSPPLPLRYYAMGAAWVGLMFGAFESVVARDSWKAMIMRLYVHTHFGYSSGLATHQYISSTIVKMSWQQALKKPSQIYRNMNPGIVKHAWHNLVAITAQVTFGKMWGLTSLLSILFPQRTYAPIDRGVKIESICLADYNMKYVAVQPGFKVRYADAHCKVGHGATGFWGIEGFKGTVFRMCSHNEEISLRGRVGKFLPAHANPAIMAGILQEWQRVAIDFVQLLERLHVPFCYKPMNYVEWCHTFPPMRRDLLLLIAAKGVEMPQLHAKSFIKKEIAVKQDHDPVFKDPRWIQGCPPELSARVGPYLKKWVKSFKRCIGPQAYTMGELLTGRQIVYTCGMSAPQIGDAFRKCIECVERNLEPGDSIVFLEDDQSRFDLHLTKGPFKMLSRMYHKFLPRKVALLLKRKISKGTSSLGTRYSIPYTMQSGWPDTSCGDTAVNAAMKYDIHGVGRLWLSIICGDDSVTVTTANEIARIGGLAVIERRYAQFGMEIEAKLSNDPLDVEFCSGRFFPADGSYILMPRVGKILAKICWDQQERNYENSRAWLRGIASTMVTYGKVDPLMRSLGDMLSGELGTGRIISDPGMQYKAQVVGDFRPPTQQDVANYYCHHYGLSCSDLDQLQSLIRTSAIGQFHSDSRLKMMAEKDM